MKVVAKKYVPDHVALSFEAEGQAERYQIQSLLAALLKADAEVYEWNDMEGETGITVRVRCAPATPPSGTSAT